MFLKTFREGLPLPKWKGVHGRKQVKIPCKRFGRGGSFPPSPTPSYLGSPFGAGGGRSGRRQVFLWFSLSHIRENMLWVTTRLKNTAVGAYLWKNVSLTALIFKVVIPTAHEWAWSHNTLFTGTGTWTHVQLPVRGLVKWGSTLFTKEIICLSAWCQGCKWLLVSWVKFGKGPEQDRLLSRPRNISKCILRPSESCSWLSLTGFGAIPPIMEGWDWKNPEIPR